MKTLIKWSLLAFTLLANPAQAGQYLSDLQKESLLKQSREIGIATKNLNVQNDKQQRELENFRRTVLVAASSIEYFPVSHRTIVVTEPRTQTQSFQSILRNTDWGVPAYTNYSASNHSIQQSQQVATTPRNAKWSNFFKNVSDVANAISSGLNQANSQFNHYTQQPNISNFQQPNNQIINTYRVGNQTLGVGGNQDFRSHDAGNMTFGNMGGQDFRKFNFGDTSLMKTGNGNLVCMRVGEQEICN